MSAPKLTTSQAGKVLGVCPDSVRTLVARGQLTGYRPYPDSRQLRFRSEDLEAYLASTRTGAPLPVPDLVPATPKPRRLRPADEGVDDVRIDPRLVTYRGKRRSA